MKIESDVKAFRQWRHEREDQVQQPNCQQYSGNARKQREQHGFCQQLSHDSTTTRANSQPYSHLFATRDRTRQQHAGEIALEGFLLPDQKKLEGPFGEWTGYYASASRQEPVFEVKAIYHRNNPIVLGVPPEIGRAHR